MGDWIAGRAKAAAVLLRLSLEAFARTHIFRVYSESGIRADSLNWLHVVNFFVLFPP